MADYEIYAYAEALSRFEVGESSEAEFASDVLVKQRERSMRWFSINWHSPRLHRNPRLRAAFLLAAQQSPCFASQLRDVICQHCQHGPSSTQMWALSMLSEVPHPDTMGRSRVVLQLMEKPLMRNDKEALKLSVHASRARGHESDANTVFPLQLMDWDLSRSTYITERLGTVLQTVSSQWVSEAVNVLNVLAREPSPKVVAVKFPVSSFSNVLDSDHELPDPRILLDMREALLSPAFDSAACTDGLNTAMLTTIRMGATLSRFLQHKDTRRAAELVTAELIHRLGCRKQVTYGSQQFGDCLLHGVFRSLVMTGCALEGTNAGCSLLSLAYQLQSST